MKERTKNEQLHITAYRTYALVWGALLILLGLTIMVAEVHLTRYSVVVNILISSMKAYLVLIFFMHLRYEKTFLKVLLLMVVLTLTSVIILTFADVWYR
jgi:cytochrome c oxidase subunit 4